LPPTLKNQRDAQDGIITVQTATTNNMNKRKIDDTRGIGMDDVETSSPTSNQNSYGSISTCHFDIDAAKKQLHFDIDAAKKQLENAGAMLESAKAHMQLAKENYVEAEQFLGDTYKKKRKELYAAGRKKRARKAAPSGHGQRPALAQLGLSDSSIA
jgi:hypothetical protein